jgi:ankyrin repeat protein
MEEVELASCMCQAVAQRDQAVLAMYLKAGASPLSCNYDERTPLHVAAAEGNLEALQLMVEDSHCRIDPLDRWAARRLAAGSNVVQTSSAGCLFQPHRRPCWQTDHPADRAAPTTASLWFTE